MSTPEPRGDSWEPTATAAKVEAPGDASPRISAIHVRISPVFQPIVDLVTGKAIGYEALSRGGPPFESADALFRDAHEKGLTWELEENCRAAALTRIAELWQGDGGALFFVNVSPNVLEDPRFVDSFNRGELRRRGLDPSRIVIEVTEKHSISDHERFQRIVRVLTAKGFQFALDDFGSGHSSLLALVTCGPRFIKLDSGVIRGVDADSYPRRLIRSLNAFAASVDAKLIAEGVERWDEVNALVRLGVRYAQGFLIARPSPDPSAIPEALAARLRSYFRSANIDSNEANESIRPLITPVQAVPVGSMTVEQLHTAFRDDATLDHVVVTEADKPRGLVTRQDLGAKLAGRYAFALYQWKPVERVAKTHLLVVSHDAPVNLLASSAMDRAQGDLYDPIIVVDDDGNLAGSVTVRSLLRRSVELQVESAQGANPLTGLPGNAAIHRWIRGSLDSNDLVIVYADLDRFKEYNDRYGFLMGDEVIRLASRVLTRVVDEMSTAHLGHIGGDDFVAVFPDGVDVASLETACREFDEEKRSLFDAEDLERGHILAKSRTGEIGAVPIVTLSLAVILRTLAPGPLDPARISHLAAALKTQAKRKTLEEQRSAVWVERRVHASTPSGPPTASPEP